MINDLFRTYKKIIILFVLLISAITFWFYGCHRQSAPEKQPATFKESELENTTGKCYDFETGQVYGRVIFGTYGCLFRGRTMPVTMTIQCKEESFDGIMRISLPGQRGEGISYQAAINCRKGTPQTVELMVPDLAEPSCFFFAILDSFGNEQISRTILSDWARKAGDNEEETQYDDLVLGVLSSSYGKLSYIDSYTIPFTEGNVGIKMLRMNEKSFPDKVEGLAAVSAILIDDFNTGRLSKAQLKALRDFVTVRGGYLFVGAGRRGKTTLEGLKKMLGVDAGECLEERASFDVGNTGSETISLYLSSLIFKNEPEWSLHDPVMYSNCVSRPVGKGQVKVLRFSLADESFRQWNNRKKIVKALITPCLKEYDLVADRELQEWTVENTLYSYLQSGLPNVFYYSIFFMVYLGLIVLGAYYLLRKYTIREYIWIVIPALSLIFTIVVAVHSFGLVRGAVNSLSAFRLIDDQESQDRIYLLYQNEDGEKKSVGLLSSVKTVEPIDYEYRTETSESETYSLSGETMTLNHTRYGYELEFAKAIPGESWVLRLLREDDQRNSTVFKTDMHATEASFSGKVTNISDQDMDKVVLVRGNQYLILGEMKAGSEKLVSGKDVKGFNRYELDSLELVDSGDSMVISNIMELVRQKYMTGTAGRDQLLVIGMNDSEEYPLFSDQNQLRNCLSMYVNHVDFSKAGYSYISNINLNSLVNSEELPSLPEDTLDKPETRAVYQFDSSKIVWSMTRGRDGFPGKIYAYNYQTKQDEPILNTVSSTMNCESLEPYISEMNQMVLTYQLEDDEATESPAPILALVLKNMDNTN